MIQVEVIKQFKQTWYTENNSTDIVRNNQLIKYVNKLITWSFKPNKLS